MTPRWRRGRDRLPGDISSQNGIVRQPFSRPHELPKPQRLPLAISLYLYHQPISISAKTAAPTDKQQSRIACSLTTCTPASTSALPYDQRGRVHFRCPSSIACRCACYIEGSRVHRSFEVPFLADVWPSPMEVELSPHTLARACTSTKHNGSVRLRMRHRLDRGRFDRQRPLIVCAT